MSREPAGRSPHLHLLTLIVAFLLLASGCLVSKARYNERIRDVDKLRAESASCERRSEDLDARVGELEGRIVELEQRLRTGAVGAAGRADPGGGLPGK